MLVLKFILFFLFFLFLFYRIYYFFFKNLFQSTFHPKLFKDIEIVKSSFIDIGQPGDFVMMIDQPEHQKSLFIFYDTEEDFNNFITHKIKGEAGAGSAAIRPRQGDDPPRAVGIPTGSRKTNAGYEGLSESKKITIDMPMDRLFKLLLTGKYEKVYIPWDAEENKIGSGHLRPSVDVKDYIYNQIVNTVKLANDTMV